MSSNYEMSPVAWLAVAMFATAVLIIAMVYLFAFKVRRDKKKQARKVENNEIFGTVLSIPITK